MRGWRRLCQGVVGLLFVAKEDAFVLLDGVDAEGGEGFG